MFSFWGSLRKKAWYNWLLILKELIYKTRNKQKVLVILSLYRMISPYVWNTSFPVKDLKANIPDVLQLLSWKSQIAYWSSFVYLECFLSYKKYKSKYSQHTWFFILKEAQRKQCHPLYVWNVSFIVQNLKGNISVQSCIIFCNILYKKCIFSLQVWTCYCMDSSTMGIIFPPYDN